MPDSLMDCLHQIVRDFECALPKAADREDAEQSLWIAKQALALAEQQQTENERLTREVDGAFRDAFMLERARDAAQAENERLTRAVDEAEKRRDSAMVLVRLNLKLADECIDARNAAQADAARLREALQPARVALSDAAAPAKEARCPDCDGSGWYEHGPSTEAEAADLGRPEEEA